MMVAVWSLGVLALFSLLVRRVPAPAALGYAVLEFFAIELIVLLVGPLVRAPLPWLEAAVWAGWLIGAIVVAVRAPAIRMPRRALALTAAALTGPVLLIGSLALAQVLPGALRIEWAMNGDVVNVLAFSRELLAAGGIDPGASDTPTPLPFAMVASAAAVGRDTLAGAAVAAHDLVALSTVWIFVMALGLALAGAIVARSTARATTALAVGATVVGSILGLVWFVAGVQLQFGFVTTSFALAVLFASWLVYLDAEHRPAWSLTALVVATAVLLAVWSPLAVLSVPLGIVVAARQWRVILRSGWHGLVPLCAAVALTIGYLVGISIPLYLSASSFLAADGGFPVIGPASVLSALGAAVLATAVAARGARNHALVGLLALAAGLAAGLGFLVIQRLGLEPVWGYYPAKFAWTAGILLLVIALAAAASGLEQARLRRGRDVAAIVGALVLLTGLVWSPSEPQDPVGQVPLAGIMRGDAFGLAPGQGDRVLELTGREDGQHVLWRTPIDEWGNRWLLQLDVDDFNTNPVRGFAYSSTLSAADVCAIVELLGDDVTVHTADAAAEAELAATCPDRNVVVSVDF